MSLETTVDGFIDTLRQFLEAMADTYAECDDTQLVKTQFMLFAGTKGACEEIIRVFHEQVGPFYEKIMAGDLGAVKGIEILDKVRFNQKWHGADTDTRASIAEYVQMLCKFSQTYSILSKMPRKLMQNITGVAEGLAEKVQNGESLDLTSLNLEDLGKQAQQSLDLSEVMQLAQMMSTDETFQNMLQK